MACFLTFEGLDGSGKSTHLRAAAAWFAARNLPHLVTHEPGGTPLAQAIREVFLAPKWGGIDGTVELLLVFASRRQHLIESIEPELARGRHVLCDRFTDATFAYQGGGRGFDLTVLSQLENWVQQGRQPDLTLWFELAPALAAERRAAARAPDRFERQDEAFFERVHGAYAARFASRPQRFARIDAARPRDAVLAQVLAAVQSRALK